MIPLKGYGGHERLVEMFALQYQKMGHEVHLLITAGSVIEGCTIHPFGKEGFPPKRSDALKAIPVAWKFLIKHRGSFDLVHNFGRLAYLLPLLHHPVKKIMTYGREINSKNINRINRIGVRNMVFTACSFNLLSRVEAIGRWEVVYNALEFSKYDYVANVPADAPLIFLGRIERVKGCHTAIAIAKACGQKLVIAGNISNLPEERAYYESEIAPHIDGEQIQYVGVLNDAQKNKCLGRAKALLFPIEWNEPFGIVMIEAMACGTPVIAFNRGSVNEVVEEGIMGFKIDTTQQMIEAVSKLDNISRLRCRQQAMKRFDAGVIAKQYLNIIDDTRKKIVIISTHQPAANPRAVKDYETLNALGYSVKHIYAYNADWSYRIDEQKFKSHSLPRQNFVETGGNPHDYPLQYFTTRVIQRLFRTLAIFSPFCNEMSTARASFSLWRISRKYPAHLYIAHYLGALPAALRAAKKHKAKLIFDAEDFHREEQLYYPAQKKNIVAVENRLLPKVNAITTASPLITLEYKKYFPQKHIITINNCFSKKYLQATIFESEEVLKLFWFSQHIGRYRGLEVFIEALNYLADAKISLTIMGNKRSYAYYQNLLALSRHPHKIIVKENVAPEEIFSIASQHDIGLAGEIPICYNKEICLSNKIFTYLLAGNCILASDTRGQAEFMEQHKGIGFVYKNDDAKDLSRKIEVLYNDRPLLQSMKKKARKLAEEEINWEMEKGPWLTLVKKLLAEDYTSRPELHQAPPPAHNRMKQNVIMKLVKKLFPSKYKRAVKEKLGVPSLHWSLQNLERKNFYPASVLDIGAYEGYWTIDLLEVFPMARVMMVEAQKNKAPFLKSIKERYPNVDYAITLLSSESGVTRSFEENETASHIVSKEDVGVQYRKMQTQTLDELLISKQFPLPDFLKLDVQGHEMEVLKGAGKSLSHATICLLEISLLNLGDDGPLLTDMIAFMDQKGFQAYDISHFMRRPFDKALYQVDMFFVKKNSFLIADKRW